MNVIKDFNNGLLNRRELKAVFPHTGNPGFAKAGELIASHFKANAENVVVKALKSKFGRDTFMVDAFIYNSVENKNMIEPKKKVKKAPGAESAPAGGKK